MSLLFVAFDDNDDVIFLSLLDDKEGFFENINIFHLIILCTEKKIFNFFYFRVFFFFFEI